MCPKESVFAGAKAGGTSNGLYAIMINSNSLGALRYLATRQPAPCFSSSQKSCWTPTVVRNLVSTSPMAWAL